MDYRKNSHTPRDMVDDEMLMRLLDEPEPFMGQYGRTQNRHQSNSCGCRNRNRSTRPTPYRMSRQEDIPPQYENMGSCSHKECSCDDKESCMVNSCLNGYSLAMAYCPDQEFDNLFEVDEALSHGTLFRELEFPFYPACESCR